MRLHHVNVRELLFQLILLICFLASLEELVHRCLLPVDFCQCDLDESATLEDQQHKIRSLLMYAFFFMNKSSRLIYKFKICRITGKRLGRFKESLYLYLCLTFTQCLWCLVSHRRDECVPTPPVCCFPDTKDERLALVTSYRLSAYFCCRSTIVFYFGFSTSTQESLNTGGSWRTIYGVHISCRQSTTCSNVSSLDFC